MIALPEHPYLDAVLGELHARPVNPVACSVRVRRLVLSVATHAGAMRAAIDRYRAFATAHGYPLEAEGARHYVFETGARRVTWEFHTEFVTVTWQSSLADGENWPDDIGLDTIEDMELVSAMRVDIIDEAELPDRVFPSFNANSLCFVAVEYDQAQLATDFMPDSDRFIRFEFAAKNLSPLRRAIMLRRILEIETYRAMALLALPLARETAPSLRIAEAELTRLVSDLSELSNTDAVRERLYALHALSVRAGQLSEKLGYRFAAARAYGAILRNRLEKLRERTHGRGASLSSFIGNRVEPALATCEAMDARLATLLEKLARAIDMLHVRIGLDMQVQNKAVLETIAETAKSQFRLQHTVEGLSTIAITYYFLGILGYAFGGPLEMLGWDKTWALSLSAPLALVGVWLGLRAIRRRLG